MDSRLLQLKVDDQSRIEGKLGLILLQLVAKLRQENNDTQLGGLTAFADLLELAAAEPLVIARIGQQALVSMHGIGYAQNIPLHGDYHVGHGVILCYWAQPDGNYLFYIAEQQDDRVEKRRADIFALTQEALRSVLITQGLLTE